MTHELSTSVPGASLPSLATDAQRARRRQLGLALFSLVAALSLSEVALRSLWQNPYRNEGAPRYVPILMHHARTDNSLNRKIFAPERPVVRFRTDDRGYILPSRRFDHPEATIAFVGGSTTECSAVAEELRFPALVSTLLEAQGRRVDTLNAGRSGNTVHDALNVVLNHLVQDRPDVVVLMEATNDIGLLTAQASYASHMDQAQTWSSSLGFWAHGVSTHSSLAGMARRVFVQPSIGAAHGRRGAPANRAQLPRDEFTRRVRAFVGLVRAFGAVPVLMTQPLSTMRNELTPGWVDAENQDVFNDLIRQVGAEERALVIDLARHVKNDVPRSDEPMNVFYDGLHVTDAGSRIYAEYVAAQLLQAGVVKAGAAP